MVIVVEGLGTSLIGAYGSSGAVTPTLDRLASRGMLLDNCFVDSLELPQQLTSMWTGRHATQDAQLDWTIWRALSAQKIPARLITDCRAVAEVAQQLGCSDVTLIDVPPPNQLADEPEQCVVTEVFSAAIEEILSADSSGLVWVHSRGLCIPWDAPAGLRTRMIDPEDPEPPMEVALPLAKVDTNTDPDLVVGWGQVATAQAAVIDQAIEALQTAIQSRADAKSWSWLITSLGGYPLGEHGQIGWLRRQMYHEEIAVPAIVYSPKKQQSGVRRGELCQLPDLCAILLECLGYDPPESMWGRSLLAESAPTASTQWPHEHLLVWLGEPSCGWIRCPAWSMLQVDGGMPQLFVKPDDRWEVNDVSNLRRDLVEQLQQLMMVAFNTAREGNRAALPMLDREFCEFCR